jgi:hypothetical protein
MPGKSSRFARGPMDTPPTVEQCKRQLLDTTLDGPVIDKWLLWLWDALPIERKAELEAEALNDDRSSR